MVAAPAVHTTLEEQQQEGDELVRKDIPVHRASKA